MDFENVTDFKSHIHLDARIDSNTTLKRESSKVSRTPVREGGDLFIHRKRYKFGDLFEVPACARTTG